jgi:hypothetical protein
MSGSDPFTWLSALGGSVAAFLASSLVYALIAIGGLVVTHRYGVGRVPGSPSLFLSADIEAQLLGRPTAELMAASPGLARVLGIVMDALLGMMLGFALLLAAVTWFGIRDAQAWALWAAVIGNGAMLAVYWLVAIVPFMREAKVGYGQLWHPYALVPTILVPVGAALGLVAFVGG